MTEMYLSIFDEGEQVGPGSLARDAASLYSAFEQVKDGRKKKGKRDPIALILTVIMLGKMAGEKSINGRVDWVKGRKALLKRQLNWASTQMNEWFQGEWAGIAQVFKIRRYVKKGEQEHEEMVYGFTNLPRKKAKAKRLLALNQKHWQIENRLHYRRDVTLGEDACQVRVKGAPQALAA